MSTNNDAQARALELLKVLWEQHKGTIFERLAELERASHSALELSGESRQEACSIAHKLAGSLGTFGFRQGSELARDSEHILLKPEINREDRQKLLDNAHSIRTLIESPRAE